MKANKFSNQLSKVPSKPGVYLFKGLQGKVIYVGKAKSLKSRIGSYFRKSSGLDHRKTVMVELVRDFSFIVTDNELEALALEANLIKQYKPKFNVVLRDDKNYPYLRVSIKDTWPTVEVSRRVKKDGALYFGPYVPAGGMWETLRFIRRHFSLRPCKYNLDRARRPCIQHQMKRCQAPCAGLIDRKEYMQSVDEVVMFLKGKRTELLDDISKQMMEHSDNMMFEEAAHLRDRLELLRGTLESQRVVAPELGDQDVVGFYGAESGDVVFQILFIRNGIMIGARDFFLKDVSGFERPELMRSFLLNLYSRSILPVRSVLLDWEPEGASELEDWLTLKYHAEGEPVRGAKVRLSVPVRGKKMQLVKMARDNAKQAYDKRVHAGTDTLLEELRELFNLEETPHSIGAFDVSNLSGTDAVGAFICWSEDGFDKDRYRHMKIRTVTGVDDYSMMRETVSRVLKDIEPPDVILIDGAKGHLDAAIKAAPDELKHTLAGLAKDPDRLFLQGSATPATLDVRSSASALLIRLRDEVHRFAISYHRKLRSKRTLRSPLEDVRGIGPKRRLELLRAFGSLEGVRDASLDELAAAPGMNIKAAQAVKNALKA